MGNFLLPEEAVRLEFDQPEHLAAVQEAINVLHQELTQDFEGQYHTLLSHLSNVVALQSHYSDVLRRLDVKIKQDKAAISIELSEVKNPATGKVFAQAAIASMVDQDERVLEGQDLRLRYHSLDTFLGYLHELFRLKVDMLFQSNVNERRRWESQA